MSVTSAKFVCVKNGGKPQGLPGLIQPAGGHQEACEAVRQLLIDHHATDGTVHQLRLGVRSSFDATGGRVFRAECAEASAI